MGEVVKFPHAARLRAANLTSKSAVKPARRARGVRKIGAHHSAGMLFLCGHFLAAASPTPISAASASADGQSETTSRKFEIMRVYLGQPVLDDKGHLSLDCGQQLGHIVSMAEDTEFLREIGHKLRELRVARGHSQADITALTGIDQSYLSKFEQGKRELGIAQARRLCRVYGITPAELFQPRPQSQRRRA